eukprot:210265-Pelagomonas_calceolata.AAC.4
MSTMLRAHCSQVACNCTRPVAASIPLLPPRPVLSRPTLRSRRLERLAVRAQDTKEGAGAALSVLHYRRAAVVSVPA